MDSRLKEKIVNYYCTRDEVEHQKRMTDYSRSLFSLSLPSTGSIVMLGTEDFNVFNFWIQHWGESRCKGYDIHHYGNEKHPCLTIKDCKEISSSDDLPISLGFNDLPTYLKRDWGDNFKAFLKGDEWLHRNIIAGGFLLRWNYSDWENYPREILTHSNLIDLGFSIVSSNEYLTLLKKTK